MSSITHFLLTRLASSIDVDFATREVCAVCRCLKTGVGRDPVLSWEVSQLYGKLHTDITDITDISPTILTSLTLLTSLTSH